MQRMKLKRVKDSKNNQKEISDDEKRRVREGNENCTWPNYDYF